MSNVSLHRYQSQLPLNQLYTTGDGTVVYLLCPIFAAPAKALRPDEAYYQRIRETHEVGGYGSIGYRAPFFREESEKLLLRTHTTSVSTAMLYEIANQPGGFKPAKMYSIDRVFR